MRAVYFLWAQSVHSHSSASDDRAHAIGANGWGSAAPLNARSEAATRPVGEIGHAHAAQAAARDVLEAVAARHWHFWRARNRSGEPHDW
jgi:hypothetical protein